MTPQRITLITLGVANLAAARAFYARLGWSQHSGTEGVAFYQMHGAVLGLFGREALADDQGRPGARLGTGAITLAQNFATEAEVDAAYAAALAAGAQALKPPQRVFWGGYSGYWVDLDGHVWEVAMNPFWSLAADGRLILPNECERILENDLSAVDEAQIADLLHRSFTTDFGGRSYFRTRHHLRLLIREGGAILAHMALQFRAMRLGGQLVHVATLGDVATDPNHRGKGLATRLLHAAINEARQSRASHLLLFGNAPLYAAAGFRSTHNLLHYLDLDGAHSGKLRKEPAAELQVLSLDGGAWNNAAELDLLGGLF
jgi:predicted N-acetyltransferase YhbS/predicted lactoylglutathione lyase